MASPAHSLTTKTTLQPSGGKPQINITGSTPTVHAIAQNQPFPASPADNTIGQSLLVGSNRRRFQAS